MKYLDDHDPIIKDIIYIDATNHPDWNFPLHKHNKTLEISFIEDGEIDYHINDQSFHLKKYDLVIKNPKTIHSEISDSIHPIKQFGLTFDGIHIENHSINYLLDPNQCPIIHTKENGPLIYELVHYLYNHKNDQNQLYDHIMNTFLYLCISMINDTHNYKYTSKKKTIEQTINDVKSYIDSHYNEKISLKFLANQFYISSYYLARKFKDFTGYTINQYLTNLRLGEAQKLLIFEEYSIKEIANMCGYNDIHYFYTVFKKETNMTPIEYQKQYKK